MTTEEIDDTTATSGSAGEPDEGVSPAEGVSSADPPAGDDIENELAPETEEQKSTREKTDRAAKRVADAEAADKRAEAERLARRKKREEAEAIERVSLREQQANALVRQTKALHDELEAKRAQVAKGGFEALKALGIEYGDWTKKALEESGPDALAQRALREAEELKAELRRRDEQTAQQRESAQIEDGKKRFEAFAESNADDFPSAAILPSRTFRALADEAAVEFINKHGYAPSFELLLPRLDQKAAEYHNELKTKSAKRTPAATTPSDGATTPQAKPGLPANAPPTRTLTPAIAGTRATPPRQMTDEEVDEWARMELRKAMRADRESE